MQITAARLQRCSKGAVSPVPAGPSLLVRRDLEHFCEFLQRSEKRKYLLNTISERANRAARPFVQEAHAQGFSRREVLRCDTLNGNTNSESKYKEPVLVISGFSRSLTHGL